MAAGLMLIVFQKYPNQQSMAIRQHDPQKAIQNTPHDHKNLIQNEQLIMF